MNRPPQVSRPAPHPDLITAPYWKGVEDGVFTLPRCGACGKHHFYPRGNCPHCGSDRIAWEAASGRGEVYSFSVVHRGPSAAFKEEVPYVVGIIKTAEGPHLFSRIVNMKHEDVRIGMKVRVKIQKFGDASLPVFEPEV